MKPADFDREQTVAPAGGLTEVVYTPESPIRHPGRLIAAMWDDLRSSRELAWRLFVRDQSATYRQSFLGYFWAFIPPVLAAVPWMFLSSQNIVSVGQTPIAYPAFVMTGMMLWQSFLDALNSPLKQTQAARPMLAKINFPREALLLAGLADALWNLAIRMVVLIPILWLYGSWTFSADNFRDFERFIDRLRSADNALSAHLWTRLSPTTRTRIEAARAGAANGAAKARDRDLESAVVRDINGILREGPLYDTERFSALPLSAEAQRRVLEVRPGAASTTVNRLLLEEAYPLELKPHSPLRSLFLAPVGLAGVILLGLAAGLFITPLGLLYNDVARGIAVVASFGMLLTPIVYPPRTTGIGGWLTTWNPMSPILVTARDWLTGQPAAFVPEFCWVSGVALAGFLAAWLLYRLTMPILIERMGG